MQKERALHLSRSGNRKIPISHIRKSSAEYSASSNSIFINKSDMISDNGKRINIKLKNTGWDINGRKTSKSSAGIPRY